MDYTMGWGIVFVFALCCAGFNYTMNRIGKLEQQMNNIKQELERIKTNNQ